MLALAILATIVIALGFFAKVIYICFMDNSGSGAGSLIAILVHILTHGFTILTTWILYANTGVA